jgi:hypothetical protein
MVQTCTINIKCYNFIFYCDPYEIKPIYRSWTPQVNETVQFSRFTQHWVCAVLIWIFSGPKTNKTVSIPLVCAPHGIHSGQHACSHTTFRESYIYKTYFKYYQFCFHNNNNNKKQAGSNIQNCMKGWQPVHL